MNFILKAKALERDRAGLYDFLDELGTGGSGRSFVQFSGSGIPNKGSNGKTGTEELFQRKPIGHDQNRMWQGVVCEEKGVKWRGCQDKR